MATVTGTLKKIEGDVVTVQPELSGLQELKIMISKVRKHYKIGDHVRVISGKHNDETGFIVKVSDRVVTLISDSTTSEIQVFTKDLRNSDGTSIVTRKDTKYRIHDLLQIDAQNVGVITKIEKNDYKVMDQNGQIRSVPIAIARGVQFKKVVAVDSKGVPLNIGDQVKYIHGENRRGIIIYIHKNVAFVKAGNHIDNSGVSVEKVKFLISLSKAQNTAGGKVIRDKDGFTVPTRPPTNMGDRQRGGFRQGGGRGPRRTDPLVDKTVNIKSGSYKGYIGIVKEVNGNMARVELHTNSKVVTVDKSIIDLPG
ncbi:hypothetical protein K502DRAFT_359419 [Neoconidiobolus thromboides FSU 785]|nr:hypothetical protein K502DRAFT_359419 [Neoconidiobolus thromboides FSU 785]